MAFDRNNPTDLATLKALVPDPNIPTQEILDTLNAETVTVGIAKMTAGALLESIFDVAVASQDQFKLQLLFEATAGLESDLSEFRLLVRALSNSISTSVDTITRFLTLAELSFSDLDSNGVNETVTISQADWITARDS